MPVIFLRFSIIFSIIGFLLTVTTVQWYRTLIDSMNKFYKNNVQFYCKAVENFAKIGFSNLSRNYNQSLCEEQN